MIFERKNIRRQKTHSKPSTIMAIKEHSIYDRRLYKNK